MSDGREEREEQKKRREWEKRDPREDWIDHYKDEEREGNRQDS